MAVWVRVQTNDEVLQPEMFCKFSAFIGPETTPIIDESWIDFLYGKPLVYSQSNHSGRRMALLGGWADVGQRMRWPYRSIPSAEAERIRPASRTLIPEFITHD